MTTTRRWLDASRGHLWRLTALGAVGAGVAVLTALSIIGVLLGRAGIFRDQPWLALGLWLVAVLGVFVVVVLARLRLRGIHVQRVAEAVETHGRLRSGMIQGVAEPLTLGSRGLQQAADVSATQWLEQHGKNALAPWREQALRVFISGLTLGALGVLGLWLVNPANAGTPSFWAPLSAVDGFAIQLSTDRDLVSRGDSVVVRVEAPLSEWVVLDRRQRGEAWSGDTVRLDSLGLATVMLGPLDADTFLRATHGERSSEQIEVRVAQPAFLTALSFVAAYPTYLERPDEIFSPGDSILLPVGTRLTARGQVSARVGEVHWTFDETTIRGLEVDGRQFSGSIVPTRSGKWGLSVELPEGAPVEGGLPVLQVDLLADERPVVTVPVPGQDTTVGPTLRQPIVIDAQDDYAVSRIELVSWRAAQEGFVQDSATELLFAPEEPTDRNVLSWVIDLNGREFNPGDTAVYFVQVTDNSPTGQRGRSEVYRLVFPSRRDLREAFRNRANEIANAADSLRQTQEELARDTEELVTENQNNEEVPRPPDELDFETAQQANEISEEQQALIERAQALADQLRELSDDAWEAGVTDPAFQETLSQLQDIIGESSRSDIEETLETLRDALENLDPAQVQEALQALSEQQQISEEELQRQQDLLAQAAAEAALASLAEDAEELAREQDAWNDAVARGERSDSSLAAQEARLAAQSDELSDQLQTLEQVLQDQGREPQSLDPSRAQEAANRQQAASQAAAQGDRQEAQRQGEAASEALQPVAEDLRQQLEDLRQAQSQEVLDALDQALVETAELASAQEDVARRWRLGDRSDETRVFEVALRSGVDQLIQQLQDASGQNALVSPDLSSALGFTRLRISEALAEFNQPTPNVRRAAELGEEALDGLHTVAQALIRSRADVEQGSQGESSANEALQQLAQLANQQEAVNGDAGSLLPEVSEGGQELLQELQRLADRELEIAEQLDQLAGEGEVEEELAEEAEELARQLAQGQLDQATLDRQQQLFRRLLDAGRSLQKDEEDERLERQSETAQLDNQQVPAITLRELESGVPFPYPEWDQLRRFRPSERRLILEYFRRLNRDRAN